MGSILTNYTNRSQQVVLSLLCIQYHPLLYKNLSKQVVSSGVRQTSVSAGGIVVGPIYRYIMFWRGICEKYQSETNNFPSRMAREIQSQDWYFSQIPLPNMIYLFNYTVYYLEHWLNKSFSGPNMMYLFNSTE